MVENHNSYWLQDIDGNNIGLIDITLLDENNYDSVDEIGNMIEEHISFHTIEERCGMSVSGVDNGDSDAR